jgi:hypothetical protein
MLEQQRCQPTTATPTNSRTSLGDASSNAPNHIADYGHHAAEPVGTATTTERQVWRLLKDQAVNFLALCGTNSCR